MRRIGVVAAAVLTLGIGAAAPRPAPPAPHWVASWSPALQIAEERNTLPPGALKDATLRQVLRLSLGGAMLRVHISNAFGTEPLRILAAHVALPASARGAILPASDHALSFDGHAEVVIPPGAEIVSDPVALALPPLADLAITLHYAETPVVQTSHPGSRATSYYLAGDHVADAELPGATAVEHWFQIAGVDVLAPPGAGAIVALGDSITDGRGSTTDGNDRWPDDLARRLDRAHLPVAVLNKGIGGNRLLLDGLGPNALARFDRDVLAPAGVRWLIVFEGINDLDVLTRDAPASAEAHTELVARMIAAYRQIVLRAHAHGIKVIGATILPDGGSTYYHPDALNEADRQAVNAWIRAPGHFDAVIDFDALMRDPASHDALQGAYDSGDHLHPGPAGYRAMAEFIPLAVFAPPHRMKRPAKARHP